MRARLRVCGRSSASATGASGQVELRLVVGPITNAGTAAKLCAALANAGLSCQPTTFDGQRLALR